MVIAVMSARKLTPRHGIWSASLTAAAGFFAALLVAAFILPSINEVPEELPAVVLWKFRVRRGCRGWRKAA